MEVPLMPMAIVGRESFYSRLSPLQRACVRIDIGRAFRLQRPGREVRRMVLHQMTEVVMYQAARLMPSEWARAYPDLSRGTEEHILYEAVERGLPVWRVGRVAPAIGG
jgi:hypothetical protein